MLREIFRKMRLRRLYDHIPSRIRSDILLRTKWFDRIGPIQIPSKILDAVSTIYLFYYISYKTGDQYYLMTKNDSLVFSNPVVRISSNCLYAFVANSQRCDCQWQLNRSLELIDEEVGGDGLVLFAVDDHGKGISGGLRGHALLYALGQRLKQELIVDAYSKNGFEAESRNYDDIHHILAHLGIRGMRLVTNNPDRIRFFKEKGYDVENVAIEKPYDKYLAEELGMKKIKLGHFLSLNGFKPEDVETYGLTERDFDL